MPDKNFEDLDEFEQIEFLKTQLDQEKKANGDNSSVIESLNTRIIELEEQNNIINKTLEEQLKAAQANNNMPEESKPNDVKDPVINPEVTPPANPTPTPEPVKPVDTTPDPVAEPKPVDPGINPEVIKSLEERIVAMEQEKAMERFNSDLDRVMKEYPNAVKEKILVEMANNQGKAIDDIAKESHEAETARIEKLKEDLLKEKEAEITERVKKELEGGNVLPQSPGSVPVDPAETSKASTLTRGQQLSNEWAAAVKKAKSSISES